MFSELPGLFDRNFAIAFYLPVSIFLAASWLLLELVGLWAKLGSHLTSVTLVETTMAVLAAWIGGILLLVLNRDIYRFLEGYGKYNPLRWFKDLPKKKYAKKTAQLKQLNEEYSKPDFTDAQRQERNGLMHEIAEAYPEKPNHLLPTSFGNTLRAFEVYPRVMYGLEGIDGWPRILAVLPKDYRELIDDAKAQVDWWVNLSVLSFVFLIEFWIVVFSTFGLRSAWYLTLLNILVPLALLVLLNWFFSWRATSAAAGWGDYVKSAFDLYRFDLIEKMGLTPPANRKTEKELWTKISQSIVFRRPDMLPPLNKQEDSPPNKSTSAK
jgi:hypothetical protein